MNIIISVAISVNTIVDSVHFLPCTCMFETLMLPELCLQYLSTFLAVLIIAVMVLLW